MSKLLFHSNAPWAPTGYGNQTRLFAPHLAKHYDLAISAFYGLEGARLNWEGIQVFPGLGGEFGNDYLIEHAKHWFGGDYRDGIVLTLMDVWVLNPQVARQVNMACWVPVDHEPTPPAVMRFFAESGAVPIAMSEFGRDLLQDFDPLYVPHAADFDVYQPQDRKQSREAAGVNQDAFLVGMVAANKGRSPSRKGFQQALEAFRIFRQSHENAQLYLHTTVNPAWAQGEDLIGLLASLQIPEEALLIADQYRACFNPMSAATMAQVYSTMDVLLNPAMGEGFGIPILEAQSCGIPAIVTNFSAMKEVCGAGWKVGCAPYWSGQKSWQAIADVGEIVGALEECYDLSNAKRDSLKKQARQHARKYAVPKVTEKYLLPALATVEERFQEQAPVALEAVGG